MISSMINDQSAAENDKMRHDMNRYIYVGVIDKSGLKHGRFDIASSTRVRRLRGALIRPNKRNNPSRGV